MISFEIYENDHWAESINAESAEAALKAAEWNPERDWEWGTTIDYLSKRDCPIHETLTLTISASAEVDVDDDPENLAVIQHDAREERTLTVPGWVTDEIKFRRARNKVEAEDG